MRKYLILTVTAGEGHNAMARFIKEKLEQNPDNEVKVIDIFKKYGRHGKVAFINDGYASACRYALPIYNMVFRNMQMADPDDKYKSIAQTWLEHETPLLINDIYSFKPDVIIGTHFYSGIMLTNLRKKFDIPAKVVSLLTDYTIHPFHECATGIDYLITPTEYLHSQLIFKGYNEKQLLPLGIPVREEFSVPIDIKKAKEELGLDPNIFTVFVTIGGGGFGGSDKILKKLLKIETPIQIIIVNGRNEEAYKKVQAIIDSSNSIHKVLNYHFVNFTNLIMSASDCIVGKCGATILNEALNKGKVMILNARLAQQEYDNMMYLSTNRACIRVSKNFPLELIIQHLQKNPEILSTIEENIKKIRKPNALNGICNFVSSLPNAVYSNDFKLLSDEEIKKLRQELKHLKKQEDFLIRETKRMKRQIDKVRDKEEIKLERQEEKEKKDQYLQAVKITKSTIYTDTSKAVDQTASVLGVENLKK